MIRGAVTVLAAASLAACGIVSPIGAPPATCQFPAGVPLSFADETTLGEVGLASPGGEPPTVEFEGRQVR